MFKRFALYGLIFAFGLILGGWLFSDVQPRSVVAVKECQSCLSVKDTLGLMGAIGVLKTSVLLPDVVLETDRSIAIMNPMPQAETHIVVVPKKDIKNFGQASSEDGAYLVDSLQVLQQIIADRGLTKYRVITNGPDLQHVTYLHFHLLGYGPDEKVPSK